MPVFHTKTIENILEPVAQQVSRLVILHEEAEDGNAMPDLERPVLAVSRAVANLVKVGRETILSSDDAILKQDMPSALSRVEGASRLLEEASGLLQADPYSGPARRKLIEGSRGILQGTSALLLCFDESEVRKLVRECKRVLDYLAVAEVIETMEDLVQFLKDLSPCLSKVSREVSAREKELTHQVHREILARCLDQLKTLAPILICSMKIFIHIVSQGGKGAEEAAENRNYLAQRMSDELHEMIRVLQLTTYDEDEWDADELTAMKRAHNAIEARLRSAYDWLEDPLALRGGLGEKSVRQILDQAARIADRSLPAEREAIKKLCGDLITMTDALCELRQEGKGASPQAVSLARSIQAKLAELASLSARGVTAVEKAGVQQPAHTVAGRLEQARRWLDNPDRDDRGLGRQAIQLIVAEGKKVAEGLPGAPRAEILALCDEVDRLSRSLAELCRAGRGDGPEARKLAHELSGRLHELKERIQAAVVGRVVQDFVDVHTPLKQFTDAVAQRDDRLFADKAQQLQTFSARAAKTTRMVAAGGSGGNKKLAEALLSAAGQLESLTPQLVSAGRIRLAHPSSKAAGEHLDNLVAQYAASLERARALCDEATPSGEFIRVSLEQMRKHGQLCEDAIVQQDTAKLVEHTAAMARLANRVLMVAKAEADNSEDPGFVHRVGLAAEALAGAVTPMVQNAKAVAIDPRDAQAVSRWRQSNKALLIAVDGVRDALGVAPELPSPPDLTNLNLNVGPRVRDQPGPTPSAAQHLRPLSPSQGRISPLPRWAQGDNRELLYQDLASDDDRFDSEYAPPRPPLPGGEVPPPRPPPPETDDEDDMFLHAPAPNQPIMAAAHGLHQEVRQWSSKDNEIIAAAKRMAVLMGRLSGLVRGEGGSKRELIACAKAIAESSEEVTRLAKELARECTDKRMRTNLLQVCERIPTIGTQLKILSTVKATMLGAQASEEDQEATDMLVGNAQNLMQSVKETVRAAEAASIKIRTDAGVRYLWVRRQPWYRY